MYLRILVTILFSYNLLCFSQPIDGASGLMKTPTAIMQTDGTLILGANYLPDAITPESFNYNTENYFFNHTFLPFLEFTYRSTLISWDENNNEDRPFGIRLRLLKESRYKPSVVVGGNDLFSSAPGIGSRYFNSMYGVATKHLEVNHNQIGFTLGFGTGGVRKENLNGIFGGVSFAPAFLPSMRLMAEYDAKVISAGAELLLWRHLYLFGMAYDLKYFAGGVAYRIYLKNQTN